ncbi:MAG: hypothetical protein ACR2PS_11060 [Pseudomonadales bacterium]
MKAITATQLLGNILNIAESKRIEQRRIQNTRSRCHRKAKRLGIKIQVERSAYGNGYWLHNTGWDDDNFCSSWGEVEEKLDRAQ